MKASKTHTSGKNERATAPRTNTDNAPDAGAGGGAPATEEDIGTEGAGTEPRSSSEVEREHAPSSKDPRNKRNAP